MNILVLCTGNSCRSQMAEGFLRKYLSQGAEVFSAGIEAHGLNPKAVEVMNEVGIDISSYQSNTIEELPETSYDYVLTVCDNAKEKCPYFPATSSILHHNFPDPAKVIDNDEEIIRAFRYSRQLIDDYCRELSKKLR